MERITRMRGRWLLALFLLVVALYAFRLYDLQIIETGGATDNTTTFKTWTTVKAARGEILDRNGNVLVGNRAGYNLTLNHYVLLSADGTYEHLYRLAKLCEEQGIEYNESFPVSMQRPFTYTLDEYTSTQQGYFQSFLAYTGGLDSDITAPLLIETLRNRYHLPEEWTDEEARQVIGLVYELVLRNCVNTLPVFELITDVSDKDLSAVVELNIPGMVVEATTIREYYTDCAAHILGYVGAMTTQQWEVYKDVEGYELNTQVGRSGLEAAFEAELHAVDGLREDTVALDGTIISSRYIIEPQAGNNVELTIDINLQRVAEEKMAEVVAQLQAAGGDGSDVEGMAVVAIDPGTGDVLACASYPTYDLSTFFQNYNDLMADPLKPTYNRALMGLYQPGSTYKMSMVIAGINSKAIDSTTLIEDKGIYDKYEGYTPSCLVYSSSGTTHGNITAAQALKVSCNYFFYELAEKISITTMDNTARMLGLGEKTGVELTEYTGYRANAETKKDLYTGNNVYWSIGDQLAASIGQSDNRFTPIQMAVYAATLANRGTRYRATFLNRIVSADYRTLIEENQEEILSVMEISEDAIHAYITGMHLVASEYGGTAYSVFKNYPIEVAAKTGTAQHGTGGSDHGAFVCFAPVNEPEIAIAIYGEKAGRGGALAQVAKAMLDVQFEIGEVGDVTTYENQIS